MNTEKFAITYYRLPGTFSYKIDVQNTKTYQYVKSIELFDTDTKNLFSLIDRLKEEYNPSYVCEVAY